MRAIIGEKQFEIRLNEDDPNKGTINGKEFDLDQVEEGRHLHLLSNGQSFTAELLELDRESKKATIKINGNPYEISLKDKFDDLLEELGMDHMTDAQTEDLKAPMPGLVISIAVEAGSVIKEGDALLVLEAMKMENVLKSHFDGTVKEVCVAPGTAVEKNELLIKFE
jgi:biotin carboxyl carrier protein